MKPSLKRSTVVTDWGLLGLLGLLALFGVFNLGACSSSPRRADVGVDAGADAAPADDNDAAIANDRGGDDAGVAVPDTPAGAQLRWLLDLLNGPPAAIAETEVTSHFSAGFLQQVPAGLLAQILAEFAGSDAPFTLRMIEASSPGGLAVTGTPSGASVVAIVETSRHLFIRITVAMAAGSDPRIVGLSFTSAPDADPSLRDVATVGARLSSVAAEARLLIARLDGDACTATYALGSDQAMPLGSLFKIYVLGALAAEIGAGQAAWTDMVTIQEDLKSLPSGVLQDQPAGTQLPVQDVAGKMISISDNTAADHLIRFVGRETVETTQAAMGHSRPALNIPFITTRELFVLKASASADERAAFIAADSVTRRTLLEQDYDHRPLPTLASLGDWIAPIDIDRLEWFASPNDVCLGFAALKRLGEQPTGAPVFSILSMNPGVPVDPTAFSYVGFKGGSEPGVLTLGWLVRRSIDGGWMVVTVGFADQAKPIDEFVAIYYATAALQIAGR